MSNHDVAFDASDDDEENSNYSAPVYFLDDKSSDLANNFENDESEGAALDRLHAAMNTLDARSPRHHSCALVGQ